MFVPERFITVHLTRLCNSHCQFCTTDPMGRPMEEVTVAEIEEFLKENSGQGFEAVQVIGGEPTLYKQLPEVLQLIRDYGYPVVQMCTNGRTLRKKPYAKQLIDLGVRLFYISLHGADAKTHDALTERPRSWAQAIEGIHNVKELGEDVQTITVVNRHNYRQLEDIVMLLMEIGVDIIDITGLCPGGLAVFAWDDLVVPYEEVFPYLDRAIRACQEAGQEIAMEGFPFCAVRPWEELCLEYAGSRKELMLFYGNLIQDFDTCLNTVHKERIPQCTGCAVSQVCGGVYDRYVESYGNGHYSTIATYHGTALPVLQETPTAAAEAAQI